MKHKQMQFCGSGMFECDSSVARKYECAAESQKSRECGRESGPESAALLVHWKFSATPRKLKCEFCGGAVSQMGLIHVHSSHKMHLLSVCGFLSCTLLSQ